jgi:glutamate-1-semialdehyde 2,1-aminomutase
MKSFPISKALHERALKSLVGGVNSPVRSFKRVGGQPILAAKAEGPYLWDVDGNRYLDVVMSYGPHLFGHQREEIHAACKEALKKSTCLGMTGESEIEWAELLLKRLPGAEKVRAMSTGTEACATAIRLARGITGRDLVVKFTGHYHGHVDSLLVAAGSGVATLSQEAVPECAGIPKALSSLARVAEFNDEAGVEAIFQLEGKQIAAVILEPIMGNMGVVPPKPAFLKKLRELCTRDGALLIFDEVMTGLRVHRHSAQGRYGIQPDLTTLGKIVGGGLPLSALAGPAKFMDQLAPLGPVYQAGTLSGNPLSVAAGIAMMKLIDAQDPYARLEEVGSRWEEIAMSCAAKAGVPLRVERVGSMMSCFFRKEAVETEAHTRAIDEKAFNAFFWGLIDAGLMMPPSPFEAYFLAIPHLEVPPTEVERIFKHAFTAAAAAQSK